MRLILAFVALILTAGTALAQTSVPAISPVPAQAVKSDFSSFDTQIAALQQRIDSLTSAGKLKANKLEELRGKQLELQTQEKMLKSEHEVLTSDERSALALSIAHQNQRLTEASKAMEAAARPTVHPVDPASLPPTTYVAPNGTTITGPNPAPGPNGVAPIAPPMVPVAPVAPTSPSPAQ